eukprot:TRINITY_DN3373_c0_g1_i1.p2 TRINITY_DN3373_c0_g1~~TRINITY_DN3373_c0_g1_i1.p2  ORF type:complete len:744 (+),score=258.07 TRINITY_DN3373_c0_g1_i1:77-2308(+)
MGGNKAVKAGKKVAKKAAPKKASAAKKAPAPVKKAPRAAPAAPVKGATERMKRDVLELGFVTKQPVGVACMAKSASTTKLAVCRVDGSVELWAVQAARPYISRELAAPARKGTTFRGVVWLDEFRFVAVTLGGQMLIYNAADLTLLDVVSSHGGSVWAVDVNPKRDTIAIACEDKRVRFFAITDKTLELMHKHSTLARPECARVLSVKFSVDGTRVFYGDNTGSVTCVQWQDRKTVWDVDVTTRVQNIGTAHKKQKLEVTPAMCWNFLEVDNSILAVTSTGEVKVIDPHTGVLLQSIRSHKADLLCIVQCDSTVFTSGVDNLLASIKMWEGEWVKAEGRTWAMGDVTAMVPLTNGVLLTGSLDGFLIACETRKVFPAGVHTGKGSVLHVPHPYRQHTHPFTLNGQRMVASVEPFSVTMHRVPELSGDDFEIVAQLRYEVGGVEGIVDFAMDPDGVGFVYSTSDRTAVVRLEAEGEGLNAVLLKNWAHAPAATSLSLHAGAAVLAHEAGVTVLDDVFNLDDGADAAAATAVVPNAPPAATASATSPCGCLALASAPGSGFGLLTLLAPQAANGGAAGKKRKREAAWGETLTEAKSVRLNSNIKDVTVCTVQGRPVAFVVLHDGTVAAFDAKTGQAVWGMDKMPSMAHVKKPQWCVGAGHFVLLSCSEWMALVDLTHGGYKMFAKQKLGARRKGAPPPHTLMGVEHALQGAHLAEEGKSLMLISAPLEKITQLVPACFWRKGYGQ